jgi:methionyl-tRNA formyltransferase
MRIVFAGSPAFAIPSLMRLLDTVHDVACVITQPDRPAGRGLRLKAPPVKELALERGVRVYQPEKFNTRSFLGLLGEIGPDLIVVVAYGKIFRRRSLGIPKLGCVNLHASLLPKYRGIAPVNWALIDGETETGVTTIFMDEGVDTGDMIFAKGVPIGEDENAGELLEKLSVLGADVLEETCEMIAGGSPPRHKQDEALASYARRLSKEDGYVRWDRPAQSLHNMIRGVSPWPGATAALGDRRIKILRTACCETVGADAGSVIDIDSKNGVLVSCGRGSLWLRKVQAPGRKPVRGADFARGLRLNVGDRFGNVVDEDHKG